MIARLHNSGHTNQLDSGIRIVEVVKKGHKWVRVRPLGEPLCKKLRRDTYDAMVVFEVNDRADLPNNAG